MEYAYISRKYEENSVNAVGILYQDQIDPGTPTGRSRNYCEQSL